MTLGITFLRTSKFFTVFYGDQVSGKELYARNFSISIQGDSALFKMNTMRLLDYTSIAKHALFFDTFCIEDMFLTSKIKTILKKNKELKYFKLLIDETYEYRISRIKLEQKRCTFFSFS